MDTISLDRIAISGSPRERGRQLGEATSALIKTNIAIYAETFAHYTSLSWDEVRVRASAFLPAIQDYDSAMAIEMEGIAEGANLDFRDILALNARTEIMYGVSAELKPECTSFALDPSATSDGHVIMGQNWDWRPVTRETCVLVEIHQPPRPSILTFAEAGLIGKHGFNSAGIGVSSNLLLTEADRGEPAVPCHAIFRGILNSSTLPAAVGAVTRARRAQSANYLIGSREGTFIDLETSAGGPETVRVVQAQEGAYAHANTFECNPPPGIDLGLRLLPDSPLRAQRLHGLLRKTGGAVDISLLSGMLSDHTGYPASICRHPNADDHPIEQLATNACVIMDLTSATMHIAMGPPCETPFDSVVPTFAVDSARSA